MRTIPAKLREGGTIGSALPGFLGRGEDRQGAFDRTGRWEAPRALGITGQSARGAFWHDGTNTTGAFWEKLSKTWDAWPMDSGRRRL